MSLPYLNLKKRKSQKQTISFYGLNYTNNFRDGELSDCMGLSSSDFPCLSQREGYGEEKTLVNGTNLYARGELCYVENRKIYYGQREVIGDVSDSKKHFATINTKVVIFPDKKYFEIPKDEKEEIKLKNLDAFYTASGFQFSKNAITFPKKKYTIEWKSETAYEYSSNPKIKIYENPYIKSGVIESSEKAEVDIEELEEGNIIKVDDSYSEVTEVIKEAEKYIIYVAKTVVKEIINPTLKDVFNAGDTIEISGLQELAENNGFYTISDIEDYTLTFDEYIFEKEGQDTVPITLKREVPDLEFICESNNRLWGVKGNTIYASALGDPTNFKTVDDLSTDSWQVAVGSDGEFTGCIAYSDNVLFFKENCVHKLLGSYPAQYQLYTYTIPGVQKGSDKSMCIINETLFYKGVEGIYAYNGGVPELISGNFGTRKYYDAVGGSYQNKYYISMRDELSRYSLYSYDLSRGIWLLEDNIRVLDFAKLESTLFFLSDNKIFKMGVEEENRIKWSATFCPIDELYHGKKGYSKIWLKVELSEKAYIKAEISVDGAPYRQVYLGHNDKQRTLQIPIKPQRCDTFSIRLSGEGRCKLKSMVRDFYIGSEV